MPGLPPDLYTQCRTVLLRCREFESYRILRTVFVTDQLFPFRIGLPSADNPGELVDRCLEYLLGKRLTGARPAMPVFLATLRDRYQPGDALRDELEALYDAVQSAMAQPESRLAQPPHRSQTLFELLLKLNFREQVRLAKQIIETHRVAAFLVHGEPNCGQQVLVNRLLRLSPGWQTGQRISIGLGSPGMGKSIRSLWRQIASKLGVSTDHAPVQIADKVCEWWQTQDVVFIFHTVDYMPPKFLSVWVGEFWQPLVMAAHSNLHRTQCETRLLMFLVDYSGCVCNWGVKLARQADQPEYPLVPLQLPAAGRFPLYELDSWIDFAAEVLPAGLTAQALLGASYNGIPQFVYDTICDRCGLSWEGELKRWLT
jgi:hypothetical protein